MLNERINDKLKSKNYKSEKVDFPKKNLMIEVTNSCNNKCIFCYNHCMKRERKFIDENLCKRVLSEAYELGMREVGFYVTGEPLLDKRLDKFIKYAKEIGYSYVYLTTNGILANLKKIQNLYKNGLDSIKYSINSINEKDYFFVHRTNSFNKVIRNLTDVYDWKIRNNIKLKVFVSYIATNYTYDKEKINIFFKDKCDEFAVMCAINQGGLIPEINKLLSNNINTDIDNKFKLPCSYPFNSVIVTVEGYLTACCMDFENMLAYADLNENTLKDAWNNSIIKKFRKRQIDGDVKNTICQNCIFNSLEKPEPLNKELCNMEKDKMSFCNHLSNYLEEKTSGSN